MYINYLLLPFLIVAINCFVACGKTNTSHKNKKLATQTLDQDELGQAKNPDTPVPLGCKYVANDSRDNVHHYVYEGSLSIVKTKEFYLQEMERSGWDIVDLSTKLEGLLFCSKTMKQCALSIRPQDKSKKHHKNLKTSIHIFVHEKEKQIFPLFPSDV